MSDLQIPTQLDKYELFIFDLDGTLYDQSKLRKKLMLQLFVQLAKRNLRLNDLKIINSFRKQRENHKSYQSETLNNDQYAWVQDDINIPEDKIAACIEEWMYEFPLPYLLSCRYKGVKGFFREIRREGNIIAIYSDFSPLKKMQSLQLEADMYLGSTNEKINQLKPSAKGIETICKEYNIAKEKTIFIGDRKDTDGQSAEMAKIDFLLVDVDQARKGLFYTELTQRLK